MDENKIYDICIQVRQITAEEIREVVSLAKGQLEYNSPLRPVSTKRQNDLGRHNLEVIDALLKLKECIERGVQYSLEE